MNGIDDYNVSGTDFKVFTHTDLAAYNQHTECG
jgi:hypothetical protein